MRKGGQSRYCIGDCIMLQMMERLNLHALIQHNIKAMH